MFGLFVLSHIVTSASADLQHSATKIIGGNAVNIESYPYQIQLTNTSVELRCGGSIISERYILTAAHCTESYKASELRIRIGSSYWGSGGSVFYVENKKEHEKYDSDTFDYDISILKRAKKLIFNKSIAAIKLPEANQEMPVGEMAVISGWGKVDPRTFPRQLHAIDVPILDRNECSQSYGDIIERMFCAGYKTHKKDGCEGDSGGALVVNGMLFGILSKGYKCSDPHIH